MANDVTILNAGRIDKMDFTLNTDAGLQIQELVQNAFAKKIPLKIYGSNTKSFFGNEVIGHPLCMADYSDIVEYEPAELVLTARAGTQLADIEKCLAEEGQMLAFEPPHFGEQATLGGTIASGLSGPRRPYAGAVRDSVLGVKCVNGKGEALRFGGQVIKNVAGYDASRLMVGALGTLAVLLEVSVKVIPKSEVEMTLVRKIHANEAQAFMAGLATKPIPLSAAAFIDGFVYLRFSGHDAAVNAAADKIGYDHKDENNSIWQQIREQTHPFFDTDLPLWRVSIAANSPILAIAGDWLIDWGGAQRWLKTQACPLQIRAAVAQMGGHATLFKRNTFKPNGAEIEDVFHPLSPALAAVHKELKAAFDPGMILNRNKFYKDI